MESGVKSRVRVGFGCHSLGFGSGSGVTSPGLGRVRVLFVGFRVFSGLQKMKKCASNLNFEAPFQKNFFTKISGQI